MRKIIVLILVVCLILAGCMPASVDGESSNLFSKNSSTPQSNISSDSVNSLEKHNTTTSEPISSIPRTTTTSEPTSSIPSSTTTSDPHIYCQPKGPVEIKVTEDFYAVDALNIFEKFSGITLVPVYTVDRVGSVCMTQERLGIAMRYYISGNDYLTMVENFKNHGFLEKNIQDHFSDFAFYDGNTGSKGEDVLYLEKTEKEYSSGVLFLKNHAFDSDYYCVAAHINRENPYNSYIKDNRRIGIKGLLSYTPIERTNSTSFLEKIDIIESTR